jgi:hypothetical protein
MQRQLLFLLVIALFTVTSVACNQAAASARDQERSTIPPAVEAAAAPAEVENNEPVYAVNEALAQVKKTASNRAESSAEIEGAAAESESVRADLPKGVVVTDVFGYQDTGGFFSYYHLVGNIYNGADTAVTNVELTISIKDASGQTLLKDDSDNPVDTVVIHPLLWTIQPGQSAPFAFLLNMEEGKPETYEASIANFIPTDAKEVKVEVQNDQMVKGDDGTVYIVGELVNLADTAVELNTMAGAALDGDRHVVAANSYAAVAGYLAPAGDAGGNDRTAFRISMAGPAPTTKSWAVYLDAEPVRTEKAPNLELSVPSIYLDEEGYTHLVGSVTNKAEEAVEVLILAGLYAADGTVLDADSAYLPYALEPGQSVPYHFNNFSAVDNALGQSDKLDQAKVRVVSALSNSYEHVILETRNETQEQTGGSWHFSGEAVNNSGQRLSWATVVVAVYDQQGQLLATEDTDVYGENSIIEPQEATAYQIELDMPATVDPANVTVKTYVQGLVN